MRFTQAEIAFNHGWLVQAEAPPGMLLRTFKRLIEQGGVTAADISFYFVHWLTDLAGAEGAPLAGAEKFVLKFPHVVLNSFIRSFPLMQQLATLSETELMERFLVEWWPVELGHVPSGPEAVALMRLVLQVQSPVAQRSVVEVWRMPACTRPAWQAFCCTPWAHRVSLQIHIQSRPCSCLCLCWGFLRWTGVPSFTCRGMATGTAMGISCCRGTGLIFQTVCSCAYSCVCLYVYLNCSCYLGVISCAPLP